jgi:hypothetical protein
LSRLKALHNEGITIHERRIRGFTVANFSGDLVILIMSVSKPSIFGSRKMWVISREDLDEIVDRWNTEVAECEADLMTAEEMLGYLGDPEVIE